MGGILHHWQPSETSVFAGIQRASGERSGKEEEEEEGRSGGFGGGGGGE